MLGDGRAAAARFDERSCRQSAALLRLDTARLPDGSLGQHTVVPRAKRAAGDRRGLRGSGARPGLAANHPLTRGGAEGRALSALGRESHLAEGALRHPQRRHHARLRLGAPALPCAAGAITSTAAGRAAETGGEATRRRRRWLGRRARGGGVDDVLRAARDHRTERRAHLVERARSEGTRKVPVEVIGNGYPIAQQEILADGELRDIAFEVPIQYSSWIALRILPSSHTNPVFVVVDGKPIRASKRSAEWCLAGVKKCREQNRRFMGDDEIEDFNETYDHAEKVYRQIIAERVAD